MFETMIQLIEGHANYGPAMQDAARGQEQIILDYHTHGRGTGYCVSIAKKKRTSLKILGQAEPLVELVHIKGVGEEEAQCDELMGAPRPRARRALSTPGRAARLPERETASGPLSARERISPGPRGGRACDRRARPRGLLHTSYWATFIRVLIMPSV